MAHAALLQEQAKEGRWGPPFAWAAPGRGERERLLTAMGVQRACSANASVVQMAKGDPRRQRGTGWANSLSAFQQERAAAFPERGCLALPTAQPFSKQSRLLHCSHQVDLGGFHEAEGPPLLYWFRGSLSTTRASPDGGRAVGDRRTPRLPLLPTCTAAWRNCPLRLPGTFTGHPLCD